MAVAAAVEWGHRRQSGVTAAGSQQWQEWGDASYSPKNMVSKIFFKKQENVLLVIISF